MHSANMEYTTVGAASSGIAPGTLCPGHIHVPGAHYTISLVKECRFVVKGCRFASVREKCMCYIWVGNHHGHWYRFFIFNSEIEVSLSDKGGCRHETMPRRAPPSAPAPAASGKQARAGEQRAPTVGRSWWRGSAAELVVEGAKGGR